jgi:proline iminopeptidase
MKCVCQLVVAVAFCKLRHFYSNINAMPSYLPPQPFRRPGFRTNPDWPAPAWVATARQGRMAYRRLGAAEGEAWLVLHGGPGSGCQSDLLQVFQLDRQQVILPDQRGAGLSRPRGGTAGNHTAQLVADIECLRRQLGIERWSVLAGSWGTVLALRYAERHPQRVERLVLRGAFGLRRAEIRGLLQPDALKERLVARDAHWPSAGLCGFSRVLARLEQVLQLGASRVATLRLVRCWNLLEQGAVLRGMWRSLIHANSLKDPPLATAIRRSWASLRRRRRQAQARLGEPGIRAADRRGWQKFRIQSHYLRHKGFVRPGELDRAVYVLAQQGIPSEWVHGRFDAVCPPSNSRQWVLQTEMLAPGLARGHWPVAGHLGSEAGTRKVLAGIVQQRRARP